MGAIFVNLFDRFNPCFGGNQKSNKESVKRFGKIHKRFQSLFWWKSEIKYKLTGAINFVIWSFNPCFGGNQKSNSNFSNFELVCFWFQSLFWWKSEIKLSFIGSAGPNIWGFNPCFGGNQKSNSSLVETTGCRIWVSILVLVEIRNQIKRFFIQ